LRTTFNERTWLEWLVRVRLVIVTSVLVIEVAIARFTPAEVPMGTFVAVIVLWYAVSIAHALLLSVWQEHQRQAQVQIATDLVFSTAVVYVTGGIDTSFNFLYPLIIIVASILLPRVWAYLVAAASFILFGAILELSYFELIPSYAVTKPGIKGLQATIFINLFAYTLIAYLSSRLAMKLRQADVELADKSGELLNLQALHENIINSMPGGVITTDLAGRVNFVNAFGAALLERRPGDLYLQRVSDFFLDPLPVVANRQHGEVRAVTPNGTEKTFGVTVTALDVPERGVVGFVYTIDDRTEVRRLEREVRMRDRLSAVGRMAAGIAHEIRNPLSSIAGSVRMLSTISQFNDDQRTLVDIVNRESERLNNIISDFLVYSREKSYRFDVTDILSLLEDTLRLLENRPQQGSGEIKIVRRFDEGQALAIVDGDRMKQVFWNICDNACRAMPAGGTLKVTLRKLEKALQLSFADTGRGLTAQQMEKIFEPFQWGSDSGAGIGMALVYQIVQAHDAKIVVHSEAGRGAEFTLELRRYVPAGVERNAATAKVTHG
jgi:two-component system sensor histidine kinase PilS (NtrC family)